MLYFLLYLFLERPTGHWSTQWSLMDSLILCLTATEWPVCLRRVVGVMVIPRCPTSNNLIRHPGVMLSLAGTTVPTVSLAVRWMTTPSLGMCQSREELVPGGITGIPVIRAMPTTTRGRGNLTHHSRRQVARRRLIPQPNLSKKRGKFSSYHKNILFRQNTWCIE